MSGRRQRTIAREAGTGHLVSKAAAKASPGTTTVETVHDHARELELLAASRAVLNPALTYDGAAAPFERLREAVDAYGPHQAPL